MKPNPTTKVRLELVILDGDTPTVYKLTKEVTPAQLHYLGEIAPVALAVMLSALVLSPAPKTKE